MGRKRGRGEGEGGGRGQGAGGRGQVDVCWKACCWVACCNTIMTVFVATFDLNIKPHDKMGGTCAMQ